MKVALLLSTALVLTPAAPALAAADCGCCWVHVWEDENYHDDNDTICGPGSWNNMRGLPGANKGDWGDEIDSLKGCDTTGRHGLCATVA